MELDSRFLYKCKDPLFSGLSDVAATISAKHARSDISWILEKQLRDRRIRNQSSLITVALEVKYYHALYLTPEAN